jgi:hypothetical protein
MSNTKAIEKRTGAILSPLNGLSFENRELVQNEAFVEFLGLQKRLQTQIDDAWRNLQELMEVQGVKSIKGDWGYITLAERKTLRTAVQLPPRFYKKVLDPSKVKAYRTMSGHLPEGVTETTTNYLSKKVTIQ